ncbi:MAG TPA: four helix bundle protein [Chitinophagaceae bacterium]|nr:four helix bundle protein [Chitinophagaceae bacterium]
MSERIFDLEDRLVEFSSRIIDVVEAIPSTRAGNYISGQVIRSGLAPCLLYGEAQAAESREDFVHKMKVVLKELKETRVCIKLIKKKEMIKPTSRLDELSRETEQLIAITAKSIDTAKMNLKRSKQ